MGIGHGFSFPAANFRILARTTGVVIINAARMIATSQLTAEVSRELVTTRNLTLRLGAIVGRIIGLTFGLTGLAATKL